MPARILVIEHDPETLPLIARTLRQDGHDLLWASDGPDGLEKWSNERPDLVILDVATPGLDGYEVATRIRAEEGDRSHVPIIMLTASADVEAKIRGLRAGADDYQVKPLHPTELSARIRGLLARFGAAARSVTPARVESSLGRVYAFYPAKGGVGATTISINTGIALRREMNRRVVLVDANLQFGDHRVFMDVGLDRYSIVDAVTAPSVDQDLLRQIVVSHESGVDLLLAPPSPEQAELVTTAQHPMNRVIGVLREMYDYVLVDIDKRLDDLNLDIMTVADAIFVVMTADLSCLKNVRLVLETLNQIGVEDDRVRLLLNRSTAYTGINVKAAEDALGHKVHFQITNDYRAAIAALNHGHPFMHGKADTPLARALTDFVRQLDRRPEPLVTRQLSAVPGY